MITYLDHFIDTRQKRLAWFSSITLGMGILMALCTLKMVMDVWQAATYEDVFALLQKPSLDAAFVSRLIVNALSCAAFDAGTILRLVGSSLRLWECIAVLCFLLYGSQPQFHRLRRVIAIMLLISMVCFGWCVYAGFHAGTLMDAMQYVLLVAALLGLWAVAVLLGSGYLIFKQAIPMLKEAMQYEVIEIERE